MNYKEAESKIFDAYFKDQIEPSLPSFCFCGNLSGDVSWIDGNDLYSAREYKKMEDALLLAFGIKRPNGWDKFSDVKRDNNKLYEELLFNGMCKALDVLKQIHIDRGEIIDGDTEFKKRELNSNASPMCQP